MGISHPSTSAKCEKLQRQTSFSKWFCACVMEKERRIKTRVKDGAAVWAKEDNKASTQMETEREEMGRRVQRLTSA